MSYKKSNRNKLPPFVALTWDLLNSRAYKALRPSSAKELPYFLGKVKVSYRDPQRYLIEFHFSYTEAKKLGFANGTHNRIICELIDKGFIDPVDKGGLRSFGMSYSLFKLSKRWEKYGTVNFRKAEDWKRFLPRFKSKATSKMETYSIKNGVKEGLEDENRFQK